MAKTNGNNGWLMRAMLGCLFVIASGTTGLGAKWLMNQQADLQRIQKEHGERLSRLEATQASIDKMLTQMDRKLDAALLRKDD